MSDGGSNDLATQHSELRDAATALIKAWDMPAWGREREERVTPFVRELRAVLHAGEVLTRAVEGGGR